MKKILITAATELEITPLLRYANEQWDLISGKSYRTGGFTIDILISGVGPVLTAYRLAQYLSQKPLPEYCIQVGVAGSYTDTIQLGELVEIRDDYFALWGTETASGDVLSVFDMQLENPNTPPFCRGHLLNPTDPLPNVKSVRGLTTSLTTGSEHMNKAIRTWADAEVETMESASFFYACLDNQIDFHAVRSISNMVAPRDKSSWDMPTAIESLHTFLLQHIQQLLKSNSSKN